jgi:hypothetical protein
MALREFAEFHTPALERDEVQYNRILGYLARLLNSAQLCAIAAMLRR